VEYRLLRAAPFTPAVSFPAPLLDALSGYHYLVHTLGFEPEDVVVVGDSAGGHLAIALVRALVQLRSPRLPQVGSVLLICPMADVARSQGAPPRENAASGWVTAFENNHEYLTRALLGALPTSELGEAWISPGATTVRDAAGKFKGFPRTLILAGEAELLVPGMRALRGHIAEGSGEASVVYREYADSTHDFVAFDWCEPQRSEALADFGEWLDGSCSAGKV
jgi:acetyl esterase/lipase